MDEVSEYRGRTAEHNRRVIEKKINGEWTPITDRVDLHRFTEQYNWGPKCGQGGLRTALALLCDLTNDDQLSLRLMRIMKRRVLAGWTTDWKTSREYLLRFVDKATRITSANSCSQN